MDYLITGPENAKTAYILAHGAGAPMDHPWMNSVAEKLATQKIKVIRFEFPYMAERRENGKKRPPNTKKVLLETWAQVIAEQAKGHDEIYIGGKSMGGRMATLLEEYSVVKGIICLGFPFHAPGKPPKDRIDHLKAFSVPTLILQGERDSMGSKEEIADYVLSPSIHIDYLPDGDHSLKPRVKSGHTLDENLSAAGTAIARFINA